MFEPMPMPNRKRCWGRVASPIHATKGYDARTDEQTYRRTDMRTDRRTDRLLASLARLLASLVPLLANSAHFARTACAALALPLLASLAPRADHERRGGAEREDRVSVLRAAERRHELVAAQHAGQRVRTEQSGGEEEVLDGGRRASTRKKAVG